MSAPAAFRATYSDIKLIKTRKCVQVIFEIPQEDFDTAYEVLGGLPNPAAERWFGIAAIAQQRAFPKKKDEQGAPKKDWRDLPASQQAGIRCEEPTFKAFMDERHSLAEWNGFTTAEAVRTFCGVKSRAQLDTDHKARVIWHQLDQEYQAWKMMEHA